AGASAFVDDAEGVDDSGGRRARNGGRVVGLECGDVDNARAVRDARRNARLERDLDRLADGQLREMNLDAAGDDGAFVRVECVGDGRERVDADGELLPLRASVRVERGDDADALAAREARTHRRAERYLAVGVGERARGVRVEVERDERGGRGNVNGGDCV